MMATFAVGCPLQFQPAPACDTDADCPTNTRCVASVCETETPTADGGPLRDAGESEPDDAGPTGFDAGPFDGGAFDAGEVGDDGGHDAGPIDSGVVDSGVPLTLEAVDDIFDLLEDALPSNLTVTENDALPAGLGARVEAIGPLPDGIALDPNGDISFSVAPHFFGELTFDYKLVATNGDEESDPATVTIRIQSVNDTPQITAVVPPSVSLQRGGSQVVDVQAFDIEDDSLSYSFVTNGVGLIVSHANANASTATIEAQPAAPLETSLLVVTVTDQDGGSVEHEIPVTVSNSMLLLDVTPSATTLFAGETVTLDASGTTSTVGGLTFSWQLDTPVTGVSLSTPNADATTLSVDRATYYAANGHAARSVPVTLLVSDASATSQSTTIVLQVLDERGPYVRAGTAFSHPCGLISRPCVRISDALESQRELLAEGISTPTSIFVHDTGTVVEDESIVIDSELDLRCGYTIAQNGTWTLGSNRSRIEVSDAIALRNENTGLTSVSNCEIINVSTAADEERIGIQVANRARLTNLSVVGSTGANGVNATGIHFQASTLASEVDAVAVVGAQNAVADTARGIRAFSPVTLTNAVVDGGRALNRAQALITASGGEVVIVGGTYTGGHADTHAIGFLVSGTASVSVTNATITAGSGGPTNRSTGVFANGSGTIHIEDSAIQMSQANITLEDLGVNFRPSEAGTMTLLNTTVADTAVSFPRTTNSIAVSIDDVDADGAFFGMTGGTLHPPDANNFTYGFRSQACFDFRLDGVDISLDTAPTAVGVFAEGDCSAIIADVDISNEAGNNTNVASRVGIHLVDTSASVTGGTITHNSAQTDSAGIRLEETGGASATLTDVTIVGHRAERSIGLDLATHYSDLTVTSSSFSQMYTAVAGGVAYGINAENGCSRCYLGRLHVELEDSLGGSTKNVGLRVYSPDSDGSMLLYSSVIDPASATTTSGVETIGASPSRGTRLAVAVLGSVVHSGTGVGDNHVAIDMRHEVNGNEQALDVVGTAIFIDQNDAFGFREECGANNNQDGTRVGRAENIAFQSSVLDRVLLSEASKTGSNCNADEIDDIGDYNAEGPYAEESATDTSLVGDLLLDDGIRPQAGSPVIDGATSLLEYYPVTAPQPFEDFDGRDRTLGPPDIGAADFVP